MIFCVHHASFLYVRLFDWETYSLQKELICSKAADKQDREGFGHGGIEQKRVL